jgi:2-amino-4-hydroxy-6-hydroxymethyldihydropteridine diphosphokinase
VRRVAFGLGANLGDRVAALQGAVDALAPLLSDAVVSSVYETDPVGGPDQPVFANAVLVGDSEVPPRDLLDAGHRVEAAWQRTRTVRWGPRTLDVDVLAVGELVVDEPDLVLPHPRVAERAFVLVPWAEADPRAVLPGSGAVSELVLRVASDGVRRRSDVRLVLPA